MVHNLLNEFIGVLQRNKKHLLQLLHLLQFHRNKFEEDMPNERELRSVFVKIL